MCGSMTNQMATLTRQMVNSGLLCNQAKVIHILHQGRDCLHLLWTGGGKSITFRCIISVGALHASPSDFSNFSANQRANLKTWGKTPPRANDIEGNVKTPETQVLKNTLSSNEPEIVQTFTTLTFTILSCTPQSARW